LDSHDQEVKKEVEDDNKSTNSESTTSIEQPLKSVPIQSFSFELFVTKLFLFYESILDIFRITDQTKLNNEKCSIKFHINSNSPQPVEILMQRMFISEFDISKDLTSSHSSSA
jgi:hypothetical protein